MSRSQKLRRRLRERRILLAPGAYDCLTARLAEEAGFEAVYMTGAGTAVARHGLPDLGLLTMSEMVENAAAIAAAIRVPLIADADTGYGEAPNVRRTVRAYERAGVAALQLEDQEFPKRCGHLDGKAVVDADTMVARIRAAVDARTDPDLVLIARTDAIAVSGLDDALRRGEAYLDAGADVLFIEAIRSREEAAAVGARFDAPLLYNVVERGKSPELSAAELESLGFRIAIHPASALFVVAKLVGALFADLRAAGSTSAWQDRMAELHEVFELVGLSRHLAEARR